MVSRITLSTLGTWQYHTYVSASWNGKSTFLLLWKDKKCKERSLLIRCNCKFRSRLCVLPTQDKYRSWQGLRRNSNKRACSYHKTSGRMHDKILAKRSAKLFTLRMFPVLKPLPLSTFGSSVG